MSTVVSSDVRRNTIVNLKQVNELPLRNALESFDKNGDGKIDLHELQKIIYWYGLWKYASIGLCLVIMLLVWSTFGLTIWAINLTKDYTVTGGVMTGPEEVVKMSVANTYIPLSWASLLDRRHLDALDSLTIEVAQGNGNFAAGVYHVKLASYVHANSTYIKLFGEDGSRVWVNSGTVVLHHPDANEAVMVCGAAACNTLAVDVKPEYLQTLVQRSSALFQSNRDFELPSSVDGVAISKAAGEDVTCMALGHDIEFFMSGQALGRGLKEVDGALNEIDDEKLHEAWGSIERLARRRMMAPEDYRRNVYTFQGTSGNVNPTGYNGPNSNPQPSGQVYNRYSMPGYMGGAGAYAKKFDGTFTRGMAIPYKPQRSSMEKLGTTAGTLKNAVQRGPMDSGYFVDLETNLFDGSKMDHSIIPTWSFALLAFLKSDTQDQRSVDVSLESTVPITPVGAEANKGAPAGAHFMDTFKRKADNIKKSSFTKLGAIDKILKDHPEYAAMGRGGAGDEAAVNGGMDRSKTLLRKSGSK